MKACHAPTSPMSTCGPPRPIASLDTRNSKAWRAPAWNTAFCPGPGAEGRLVLVMKHRSVFWGPFVLLTLVVAAALPALSQVSVLTRGYDNQRTGTNLSETILNQSNVNANQFGKLFQLEVDD